MVKYLGWSVLLFAIYFETYQKTEMEWWIDRQLDCDKASIVNC